jgi:D-alanyl-D-alanine endopeptidase (penicillin-binding protein 7)
VHRIVAVFVAAALSWGACAADKQAPKARVQKASQTVEAGEEKGPFLRSSGAIVIDAVTGQTLYEKNSHEVTPIASITKLMTAMVILDARQALDEPLQITTDDIDLLKNTKSRLPIGSHFRRDDLMRLALMASDNRAASALGRNYPGGILGFVDAMNLKAASLGMNATRFVDSSGLSPANVSSGEDLAKLVAEAARYDLIREYSTTEAVNVTLPDSKRKLSFVNTNRLVRGSDWQIGVSKTGYISESGMCLVMQAIIANQPVVIVLLDSWGKLSRVADAQRIKKWLEKNPTKVIAAQMRSG